MRVTVAAGHTPTGTVGCGAVDRLDESKCTREIAPLVEKYLQQGGATTNLQIINKGNSYNCEDCYVRAQNSNNWGADFYVEVHLNAGGGIGSEVEVCGFGGKAEEVAHRVTANISNALGIPNRGVKQMNLIVLNKTNCPAILVECCFVDSSDADKYNADKIAKAIAEGILGVDIGQIQVPIQQSVKSEPINPTKNNNNEGDYMSKVYKNGSTKEIVYETENCTQVIGSLDPYETCEAIADVNGKIVVLYNSPNGKKVGFVKYRAGL